MLLSTPTPTASTRAEELSQNNHRVKMHLSHRVSMLYANIQADYAKKLNVTVGGEFPKCISIGVESTTSILGESAEVGVIDPRLEM